MSSSEGVYRNSPRTSENRVSLGAVLNMPEHRLAEVLNVLESLEGVRLIYKKAAFYELYISPYPPSCWKEQGA